MSFVMFDEMLIVGLLLLAIATVLRTYKLLILRTYKLCDTVHLTTVNISATVHTV